MRLFLACNLSQEVKDYFARQVKDLEKTLPPGIKWVDSDNYHITLKFLGDTSENKAEEIITSLSQIETQGEFTCKFEDLSAFPAEDYPRVLISKVTSGRSPLLTLQEKIEEIALNYGFAPEKHDFTPHVTLGRVKDKSAIKRTARHFNQDSIGENIEIKEIISKFSLIKSILRSQGPIYKPIFTRKI